jgi:hypothetical protein
MRRILICTGVLGGGTALTFAAAALAATLFPNGTLVAGQANPFVVKGGVAMPAPAMPAGPIVVDDSVIQVDGLTPEQKKELQLKLQNAGGAPIVTVESPEPDAP